MAKSKSPLDGVRAALGGLASKLPFVGTTPVAPSPEPFSAIEDDTPLADLSLSANAAPAGTSRPGGRQKPDFKGALAALKGNRAVLIGLLSTLAFGLVLAAVAVAVALPPKETPAAKGFTKEGEALVRTWILPPGDPLEPRMEMQRARAPVRSAAEASSLGIPDDGAALERLAAENDAAIEKLYGTVP